MAIENFPRRPVDRPSTQIQTDTTALTGSASDSEKPLMLIGSAQGGQPDTVYRVRNLYDAQNIFRGGELLDALEMAWNPSNESPGAGDVFAMRVEDAKPASVEQGGVTFQSKIYGQDANDIELELRTSTYNNNNNRNLTVNFPQDNHRQVYRNIGHIISVNKEEDSNVGYVGVEIADDKFIVHIGDGSGETGSTTDDSTTDGTVVEGGSTGTQSVEFTLGSGPYAYASRLVNELNTIDGIVATMPTTGNKNINTAGLDPIPETEVTADNEVRVTGLLADLVQQLEYDPYIELNIPDNLIVQELSSSNNLVVDGGVEIQDFGPVTLEDGETGVVPESWGEKIKLFANEGGYYLVPLTDKESVHAEASAFVNDRTANGDPMRAIVGGSYDETPERLLGRATTLRNSRVALTGISGTRTSVDGRVKETPAYLFAAQIAGLASGLPVGEAVTFKQLSISNLSTIHDSVQMDALNAGGVIMAEFVRNRTSTKFRVVDDVTTYNDQNDPVNNQLGVGEAHDFLVSELKIELDENYIGNRVIDVSASLIKNSVESFLDQKKRDNEILDYNPEDVQVIINGEVANISMVIEPIRNIKRINVSLVYKQEILES